MKLGPFLLRKKAGTGASHIKSYIKLKYLEALYEVYKKRWNDMAEAISLEMGSPIDFSTQLQAGTGASHIKSYIKVLKEDVLEIHI